MSAAPKPHSEQLRVTEGVYELLVQEKRRRRELEEQLESYRDVLRAITKAADPVLPGGFYTNAQNRLEWCVRQAKSALSNPAKRPT